MTKEIRKHAVIHIILWAVYWTMEYLVLYLTLGNIYIQETLPNCIINMMQFYIILYYILPQKSIKINQERLIYGLLILFILFVGFKLGHQIYIESLRLPTLNNIKKLDTFFINLTYRFFLFTIYAGFIWFFTTRNKLSKILLEKELQEERLKNSLLLAQQSVLKAKINPHFLFNTLNFLYSKSVTSSDEVVSKTILLLSDVFRYSLKNEAGYYLVNVDDEITHIKRLIKINKLRFNNVFYYDITSLGEEHHKKIPPFILLTLFENAIKHGDYQNTNIPILLTVEQSRDMIKIQSSNLKKQNVIQDAEGFNIGTQYIVDILRDIYKEKYILEIEDLESTYTITIAITTDD